MATQATPLRAESKNISMEENVEASSWATAGDCLHVLTIVSTLCFALVAGTYMRDPSVSLFDSQWRKEGFCITNRDVPYWTSHDMCLYVDTFMSVVLGILFWAWRKDPGMKDANSIFQTGIPGVLLHGFGHGALGKAIREGTMDVNEGHKLPIDTAMEKNNTPWEYAISVLPLIAFWLFLSKASMPQLSTIYVVPAATLATLRQLWTPNDFGFTYVQTILMLQFSINQLCRRKQEKDFGYFLYPGIVGLPLTLVGWMESTLCSTVVRDFFYGHVVYDAYIPLSMMAWYTIVHNQQKEAASAKIKQP